MSFVGLNIAGNIMRATRNALDIAGKNIANADTEGYSRQEAVISLLISGGTLESSITGATVSNRMTEIKRYRNQLMDSNYRTENQILGEREGLSKYLTEVSSIFSDVSDYSLSDTLNKFWNSWNTASQTPEDVALRNQILEQGKILVSSIKLKATGLQELKETVTKDIYTQVDEMNSLTEQLASVNSQIALAYNNVSQTNTLLDQRDLILDKLSKIADIQIVEQKDSRVNVYLDGTPLVDGNNSYKLEAQINSDNEITFVKENGREVEIQQGLLKGYQSARDEYIPSYMDELNQLATSLIEKVNQYHNTGYGLDESTGLDFFSGTDALDIKVNITDPRQLALSSTTLESATAINVEGKTVTTTKTISAQAGSFNITPEGSGVVSVNGVEVAWTDDQTLNEILDSIESATGLTVKFDSSSQKIILSNPPDSSSITVSDVSGNLASFTGLEGMTSTTGSVGNGENGVRIFELSTEKLWNNQSFTDKYTGLVSRIGYETSTVNTTLGTQEQYVQMLNEIRKSESGVSIDDEVMSMVKYQTTYQAAAKYASVIDELFQTLLNDLG